PFPAAAIRLEFPGPDAPLLPTGRVVESFDGVEATCVDAGMPVVLVHADSLGITGYETPEELEHAESLKARVEDLRRSAGSAMGLGDVADTTIPKVSIVQTPYGDGDLSTRTFIPSRVHASIGVFGAISVAAAAPFPASAVAPSLRRPPAPAPAATSRTGPPTGPSTGER